MLIDFHTHAFPDKIAGGAMEKLSYVSGGLEPQSKGTLASLKEEMAKDGVDISVVQSIATNPKQQKNVNDFAMEMNKDDSIIAFGSVHPDSPDALEELERIKESGLKGVKFHPEYQSFFADEERMKPIYKKVSSLGLIALFHAGVDYGFHPPFKSMPDNMLGAIKWFDSPVVLAHWGGEGCYREVMDKLCGIDNVWFDTSFGYATMPRCYAMDLMEKHTPDRFLFGSDLPWHRPSWEMRLLETLELTEAEKEKIYCKNAQKLLGI